MRVLRLETGTKEMGDVNLVYLYEFWPAIVAVVGVYLGLRWFVRASKQQAYRQAQYRDRLRNL